MEQRQNCDLPNGTLRREFSSRAYNAGTGEIGVRMALGGRADVVRLVLRGTILIGLVAHFAVLFEGVEHLRARRIGPWDRLAGLIRW